MRHNLPALKWRKSPYSDDQQAGCVEIQTTVDDLIAIGDSKDRPRGALTVSPRTWAAFTTAVTRETLQPVS
ncbi:DUF397 domain-containing protein [Streptomyces sp. ISL-11]|nr:DUF397 domain-containing protein [Streptomyces sp. ISL-11]